MSKITISKPRMRWLFGGVGFHNSEATMTALMSDDFLNQVAVKTFREISPTFSRLFAGYADWTREAMDAFADYYDKTFRDAKTLLYIVPGRMPMIMDDFDPEEYCERVASNLDYLINVRKCTKIRYYCVTNADGSVSIAIINWDTEQKNITLELEYNCEKPLRRYVFEAQNIPYNEFNDLQKFSGLIKAENEFSLELPPRSMVFLTTDYTDRTPSKIKGVKYSNGKLVWNKCRDEEHCYYRVYCDGKQVASTVA